MSKLSHLDTSGRVQQVDVSHKSPSLRRAVASCLVYFPLPSWEDLQRSGFVSKKGAILETARMAGIMAAKRTSDLIPLCHPLMLEHVEIECLVHTTDPSIQIQATVAAFAKTGVEMEALVACQAAALTVYDMCKALTHEIVITELRLEEKSGGKHDFKRS